MAIVDEDIERVRSATSIVDVVQQHVQLKRVGTNWVGLCPFHAERTGSFNVREQTGRYRCFGCGAAGDAFTFVQEIDHVDFVTAVELLAGRAGIELRHTSSGESRERQQRKQLVEVMGRAVEWYHERLLQGADAGAARGYLRSRGFDGEAVRQYRLGWAPDDWDALARSLRGVPDEQLTRSGLAFVNRRGRLQDAFRARVLFPIFNEAGDPVAFGGRVLPGSTDPAKYKNSPETPIYAKSRTLYGLNWAKGEVVQQDRVVVCEGYTDVIGFHRSGVPVAVATCGTALTGEHVRLMRRFARHVVLAFDADAAGQGAAERFYEWERQYDVQVSVARLPAGSDPADLAARDPAALRAAIEDAQPFLGFRLQRVMRSGPARTPEDRARLASAAMAVVNEHPNLDLRKIYAGQIAREYGLPDADLMRVAERQQRRPEITVRADARPTVKETAEFVVLALLLHRWDDVAPWLVEALFADDIHLRTFRVLAATDGDVHKAIAEADPEVAAVLERLAVTDVDADPALELRNLAALAARRELAELVASGDLAVNEQVVTVSRLVEQLNHPATAWEALQALLRWLSDRREERD